MASHSQVATRLASLIGDFKNYGLNPDLQKKLSEKTVKVIGRFKDTLKETLLLEDYEEEGVISVEQLRECLKSLQVEECDEEMM